MDRQHPFLIAKHLGIQPKNRTPPGIKKEPLPNIFMEERDSINTLISEFGWNSFSVHTLERDSTIQASHLQKGLGILIFERDSPCIHTGTKPHIFT